MSATLDQYIVIDSQICAGKPRLAGHRITVENIAIWHDRMGRSVDEIAAEYDLTLTEVHAALAYYFGHREEIDQRMRLDNAFVEEFRRSVPSALASKLALASA